VSTSQPTTPTVRYEPPGATIELPPLRARRGDVLELVVHFLARAGAGTRVDADAAEALLVYDWPFNVRELAQIVAAATDQGDGSGLRLGDLPPRLRGIPDAGDAAPLASPHPLQHIARDGVPDRAELQAVLQHFGGNVKRTAAFFARDRRVLYRWCEQHELDPKRFRTG
jgi:DNA-binding NtrC family response regulator